MEVILMREEWKYVSMKRGVQFVMISAYPNGMSHKQMLFVCSWDSLELVSS